MKKSNIELKRKLTMQDKLINLLQNELELLNKQQENIKNRNK